MYVCAGIFKTDSKNQICNHSLLNLIIMKKNVVYLLCVSMFVAAVPFSCQKKMDVPAFAVPEMLLAKAPPKVYVDVPVISCYSSTQSSISLLVTAGASGMPAGFSVQWMPLAAYEANGNNWGDTLMLCHGSFSGNANLSRYNLAAGESVVINVGEFLFDQGASSNCINSLTCGTAYIFRVFAHATSVLKKSEFSTNLNCNTLDCFSDPNCTYTQGFWKTHGPVPTGSNDYMWPQSVKDNGLMLGTVNYSADQLLQIFNRSAAGNGLVALAHQLIAAKINVAYGAQASVEVLAQMAAADVLIGSLVIPPIGVGSLPNSATGSLITSLTSFNEGNAGVPHCQ